MVQMLEQIIIVQARVGLDHFNTIAQYNCEVLAQMDELQNGYLHCFIFAVTVTARKALSL